jgi:predicted permease
MREIKYALRRLRGSPIFTIAATLTLAITIGATASVFGLVDGVLLRAFPYRDPQRVLVLWATNPGQHIPRVVTSAANYVDWEAQSKAFATLAAAAFRRVTVERTQEPERVPAMAVTPQFFPVVGITPVLGRVLAQDSAGPSEVVISSAYWQRRFGGASSVLGQTLLLDGQPHTIVGVVPDGVVGGTELWTRLTFAGADLLHRAYGPYVVFGRLKPGVTRQAAQTAWQTIARRLERVYPETNAGWSVLAVPIEEQFVGNVKSALMTLLCAAGCVLLIGAANLANLFLVRCLAREREMAVRAALGATRGRLARELVVEAATVGLAAGAIGVGVAVGGVQALRALAPRSLPRMNEVGVNGQVIAFCALASIAAVLIFGVFPAWRVSRDSLANALKEGARGTSSAQNRRLQDALVVLQLTIALVLLTGAGLLVASFRHFQRMDPGFRPEGVLTALIELPDKRYPTPERQAALAGSLAERLAAQPGVTHASVSDALPSGFLVVLPFSVIGDPPMDPTQLPAAYGTAITPDYFRVMGIRLVSGRGVLPTDDARSTKIAVVDERFVRRVFAARDPIGRRIALEGLPDTLEIVGVAASVKQNGLATEDRPEMYVPFSQFPAAHAFVALRTSANPVTETRDLKEAVASVDPTMPISDVESMNERMAQTIGMTRFSTFLASLFAVVALGLGAVGIYSVLAYIVSLRQREIAVRIALGASIGHVMGDVLRRALALTGIGIAVGALLAWILTRMLAGLFLGVGPHDPSIFAGAAGVFAVVALAAASVPAFRATRVNPVVALTSI